MFSQYQVLTQLFLFPVVVRAASTSKVMSVGVPIKNIMKRAGWSNESIFRKFYAKEVLDCSTDNIDFGSASLQVFMDHEQT